eukprot:8790073-Karenia_brevis.AAC.1
MGNVNAVDIAQLTHESILQVAGCLRPNTVLRYREPVPDSDILEGVYIDDHIILHILKKEKLCVPEGPDVDLLNLARKAYHEGFMKSY